MFPAFYNRKKNKPFEFARSEWVCDEVRVPVRAGIPYFAGDGSYASLFGDQWKKYKKTQLDSYSGTTITADRLNRCLGEPGKDLSGKLVLEAGCGAGRFTEILLQKNAVLVSADMSSAVEVNQENFPQSDRHMVIQADINDMPYADESFDLVICLGVIQHTPIPEQTIRSLYQLVKKGGWLVIDHYTYTRSNLFRFVAPVYRWKLKKQPATITLPATQRLVKRFLPLHKRFAGNKLASMILNRISPVISYYSAFPQLNDQQQEEWALLDTHDSLTDWHKHFRNRPQIIHTLKQLGAADIWCEYGGNGVEARCKKG